MELEMDHKEKQGVINLVARTLHIFEQDEDPQPAKWIRQGLRLFAGVPDGQNYLVCQPAEDGAQPFIVCLNPGCGFVSYEPHDIVHTYCRRCQEFHE
jgi:hypothetical protein